MILLLRNRMENSEYTGNFDWAVKSILRATIVLKTILLDNHNFHTISSGMNKFKVSKENK